MGHLLLFVLHVVCLLFFAAGLLLTLPMHLIYAVVSSRNDRTRRAEEDAQRELLQMVRCGECRELVRWDAVKCKHCGATLTPAASPPSVAGDDDGSRNFALGVAFVAGLVLLAFGCSSLGR
jgi:hypothetical protein